MIRCFDSTAAGNSARGAIVKQDEQLGPGRWCVRAVSRKFQNRVNLFPRHAEFFHRVVNVMSSCR
jgi:hypothetical protein